MNIDEIQSFGTIPLQLKKTSHFPCIKMVHCRRWASFCACVSQVSCVRRCPTWTGRPRTSSWCCSRPKTWGDTWADYPGPPPSQWSSLTSTTILHASLRVSYSAAQPTAGEWLAGKERHHKRLEVTISACTLTVCAAPTPDHTHKISNVISSLLLCSNLTVWQRGNKLQAA